MALQQTAKAYYCANPNIKHHSMYDILKVIKVIKWLWDSFSHITYLVDAR